MKLKSGYRKERQYCQDIAKLLLIVLLVFVDRKLLQHYGVASFTTTTTTQFQQTSSVCNTNDNVNTNCQTLSMYSFAKMFEQSSSSSYSPRNNNKKVLQESLSKNSNVSPLLTTWCNCLFKNTYSKEINVASPKKIYWPIASGQDQLAVIERIGKAVYEESLPWITTFAIASIHALLLKSTLPLTLLFMAETSFLTYCTAKLIFNFNVPKIPEPLLRNDWESFAGLVWSSQRDIQANRSYLMGWFYDVPYEQLREEDALSYLAWMKHGVPYELGLLGDDEVFKLETFDYPLLIKHTNNGYPLQRRQRGEKALSMIRFNFEPLRYRHKPLIFYCVTHGIHLILHQILKRSNFIYVPATDAKKDIGYWYRLPTNETSRIESTFVFAHGVGGLAFCYKLINDLLDVEAFRKNTPIILLDLPHISLRMYDHIPKIVDQVESVSSIIDKVTSLANKEDTDLSQPQTTKATFVGHSYGTFLLSWMVQTYPDKIGGCVFIDPVCFNLHLKDVLFNFHMQRVDKIHQAGKKWSNPLDIGSLRDMAGTEMHTNNAMLRQFSWAVNSLWPDDLKKNNIPATVVLSEKDEIVPTMAVKELFHESNNKANKTDQSAIVKVFENACHGQMFFEEPLRKDTVGLILDLIKRSRQEVTSHSLIDRISNIKKEYQDLNDSVGELWDQISYILPGRTASTVPKVHNISRR